MKEPKKCGKKGCDRQYYAKGECKYHRQNLYQKVYHKEYQKTDKYKTYMKAYYLKNKGDKK